MIVACGSVHELGAGGARAGISSTGMQGVADLRPAL